ncbi:MAG: type 4a pilus biogenesis protein PilO [Patescibacteria group bacterium]
MKYTKKISISYKIYILSIITAAVTVCLLFFITIPFYTKVSELTESINGKRIQLASFQQQRENIEQTRTEYNTIKTDIESVSKIFIKEDNVLEIISTLEEIALTNNIIQSISMGTFSTEGITRRLDVTLSLQGTWNHIIQYLSSIERLDYYISMSDLAINTNTEGTTVSINASFYSIP